MSILSLSLIFSKDRALQLHGTLSSLLLQCSDIDQLDVRILYTSSTQQFEGQYQSLAQEFKQFSFVRETDFRKQILDLVKPYQTVLFIVDDNLFIEPFSIKEVERYLADHGDCLGFSLRLGLNTTYCFSTDVRQQVPSFEKLGQSIQKYRWVDQEADFGYPLEVSSSAYRVADLFPLLQKLSFNNPNSLEAALSSRSEMLAGLKPNLLCYASSRTFCVPFNLVQRSYPNRHAELFDCSVASLGQDYENGWRIAVEKMAGVVPQGCHQVMQLPLRLETAQGRKEKLVPAVQLKFSIIIPCFNQGRFLIDCLESVVRQSEPPAEVIVVNDGSTDEETCKLFERLAHYYYPFPVHVLHKPNGGPSSARNFGIAHSTGDIILPLDGDDILMPNALESYRKAFINEPSMDAFYPDTVLFGDLSWIQKYPNFNSWRLTQENLIPCSTAMRRKIFAAGFWYDERIRGYEDNEFWIRTFALGPFKCAPLKKSIFGYRVWGFSLFSAVDSQQIVPHIRTLHAKRGIWSPDIERQLRKNHAPSHCLACEIPAHFETADDMMALGAKDVEKKLTDNFTVRFLWFGSVPPEVTPFVQFTLNEISARSPAPAYLFRDVDDQPFLVVLDRFWALKQLLLQRKIRVESLSNIVVIKCHGNRHPGVQKITRQRKFSAGDKAFLSSLGAAQIKQILPPTLERDFRTMNDLRYYLAREPAMPRFIRPDKNDRVLAIAMPNCGDSSPNLAIRCLLEDGSLRHYFSKILVFTFEDGSVETFSSLESLVDASIHFGNLGLSDSRKLELTLSILQSSQANNLFIVESVLGYQMIPLIRKAKLPIRISAQIHDLLHRPGRTTSWEREPALLATHYANLLDRVASVSDELTARMVDEYYFPAAKIRTVKFLGDQKKTPSFATDYAQEIIAWLFSEEAQASRVHWGSVFGLSEAA